MRTTSTTPASARRHGMEGTCGRADRPAPPSSTRWLRRAGLVLCAVGLSLGMSGAAAVAEPSPPGPVPDPGGSAAPNVPAPAPPAAGPATAALNSFIDPAVLEQAQQSIVGLVIKWKEPEVPFWVAPPPDPAADPMRPVDPMPPMAICTGWFDTPTTIVTAGHCVDPKEGRAVMDLWNGLPIDPEGNLAQLPANRPDPEATVVAFQPRELAGAVITAPTVVRIHSFRTGEQGDTAKLEVHGLPPAKPLPIAPAAARLGESVTSIGFPGLNISETDGIDLQGLMSGGKDPAEALQDSRLYPVSTSGTIMSRQFRNGASVYQVNADFDSGMSGGPTINPRGEVLGVNSQMTVPFFGQNLNIITDTGMLREFLGHDQPQPQPQPQVPPGAAAAPAAFNPPVEPTTQVSAQAAPSDPAGVSAPSIGWIVAGSVIGGALLGGLLIPRLRRPRPRHTAGQPTGATPQPAPA